MSIVKQEKIATQDLAPLMHGAVIEIELDDNTKFSADLHGERGAPERFERHAALHRVICFSVSSAN